MSKIEWTEKTWNPIVGCSVTSSGCKNCYAMKMAGRLEKIDAKTGKMPQYRGTTKPVNGNVVWTGKIGCGDEFTWTEPLRRKKPTMYFVNSMGDLFHPNVPTEWIDRAFAVMALSPQHIFQVLTKYPERMRDWMREHTTETWGDLYYSQFFQQAFEWSYFADKQEWLDNHINNGALSSALCCQPELWPNVWLGVSVEDQKHADARIPFLLDTPAAIRFISAEPLLGAIDLNNVATSNDLEVLQGYEADGENYSFNALVSDDFYSLLDNGKSVGSVEGELRPAIDWVICGGESGPNSRPMHPDWARSLRDQCAEADVLFFFKQWGEWLPWEDAAAPFFQSQNGQCVDGHIAPWLDESGEEMVYGPKCNKWTDGYDFEFYQRVGKKAAGRLLDGVEHNALPAAAYSKLKEAVNVKA